MLEYKKQIINYEKILFFCCFLIQATILRAQFNAENDPFLVKSLTKEAIKNVEINAIGGNIALFGSRSSDFRLEVHIRRDSGKSDDLSKEDIQKMLEEEYVLNIAIKDNKLNVAVKWKKTEGTQPLSISFKVLIPQNVSSNLFTAGGNIMLKNVFGVQDFKTSGGNLYLDSASGTIDGHTSGGNIMVSNSHGEVMLETSGGDIMAENVTGNLKLLTSGGAFKIKKLGGVIYIQTTGGSISGNNIDGELTAKTSSGNINLGQLSCSLDVSTSRGDIDIKVNDLKTNVRIINSDGTTNIEIPDSGRVDLEMTGYKIKTNNLSNFKGSINEKRIFGTLNGGGIPFFVKAGNGEIFFQQKDK